jgi:hypothetical protein
MVDDLQFGSLSKHPGRVVASSNWVECTNAFHQVSLSRATPTTATLRRAGIYPDKTPSADTLDGSACLTFALYRNLVHVM